MNQSILKVKISIPPLGTGILPRPRLQEALDRHLRENDRFLRRLTLVSAPAGYGKTTQVRTWLAGREKALAWYSLDPTDDEPGRFWTYLIAAMQEPVPGTGSASAEAIQSTGPDRSASAGAQLVPLLNDLFALEQPLYLVLDDYHHIENPGIHQDMIYFLENLPPAVHVIVTTRSDPPWPLARWRARNTMDEVRLEELRFTGEEVAHLCMDRTGLSLAEKHLSILTEKTEGWIAGLQLAVHSLASHRDEVDRFLREFDGSHRHVLHFLSEEILNRQSRAMQEFLLRTAVLERFCASLCDAVIDRDDSDELISRLVRENLFILRLDERGTWFRYHALFADLLRYRLKREDPGVVSELHRRASAWYLSQGMPGEAIRHARLGDDRDAVIRILEDYHDTILALEGPGQLIRCLEDLPDEALQRSPIVVLFKALYFLNYFGRERADPYLRLSEELSCETEEAQRLFRGMRSTVLSFRSIYSHDLDRAIEYAEEALRYLPADWYTWRWRVAIYSGDARFFSGNPREAYSFYQEAHRNALHGTNRFLPLTTGLKLATALHRMGRLEEAWTMTRDMLATARREGLGGIPRVALHWGLLGELNREYGNLEESERCLERALVMGSEEKPGWGWNSLYLAALYHSRGEPERVLETTNRLKELNRQLKLPSFVTIGTGIWTARALVSLERYGEARGELVALNVEEGKPVPPGLEWAGLVLARIMIADLVSADTRSAENVEHASELLYHLQERTRTGGELRLQVEALLLQGLLAETLGNAKGAGEHREAARALGCPAGYHQVFIDEGEPVSPEVGNRIEEHTVEGVSGTGVSSGHASSMDLVEDLSARELEILRLVEQGLSNEEIGEKLFISPGTVKWHLSNVFGKLGVSKRTRAVAVARELGVLV